MRDWKFPRDIKYGMNGGNEYLKRILDPSTHRKGSTLYNVREQLHNSFTTIQSFLMPHPGQIVIGADLNHVFNGVINGKALNTASCMILNFILKEQK